MISYTLRNGVTIAAHATGEVVRPKVSRPRISIKRKQSEARRALAALFV